MIRRTLIARLFTLAVLAALAGPATAGLLPVSVTVQPEAGNFRWTYSVVLPTDMKLQSGNFFTIYDFAGYVPGSATVSSTSPDSSFVDFWSVSATNVGPTPNRLNPQDDPNTTNLTFRYNGPTIPSGQLTLGNFSATSMFGTTQDSFFTATNPRAADGQIDSNITSTLSPRSPTPEEPGPIATPEPATLLLAGLGLPLVGLGRALRRKPQAA